MKKILGVCTVAAMVLAGCGQTGVGQTEEMQVPELIQAVGVDMDTEEVVRMDLSGVTSFAAQIVPKIEALSFMSSGSIENLKVSIGDKVKKGQLLATLAGASGKAKSLQEEMKTLKATNKDVNQQSQYDIEMLEENVKTLEKQYKKETGSAKKKIQSQIVEAQMDVKIAQEKLRQQKELQALELKQKQRELDEAQASSKNNKLYSTINGEVVGTTGGTGYMVQGGNVAIQVANMEKPRLKTDFISASVLAKASSCMAVIDGKKYEIVAEQSDLSREDIEMGVVPESTWFDFVDENVRVEVGKSASVDIYTDSVKDALVVPANAVYGDSTEHYVYVVTGDARTKMTVVTGTETDAFVQIVSGVEEGDVVYVGN